MLSIVTRAFRSDRPHAVGEIVDTTGWRLERQLREQHYIRPLSEDELAEYRATQKKAPPPVKQAGSEPQAPRRTAAAPSRRAAKPKAKTKTRRRAAATS